MSKTAIYSPPKGGLPYLVVTVRDSSEISSFMPVASRDEARRILAGQNIQASSIVPFPKSEGLGRK